MVVVVAVLNMVCLLLELVELVVVAMVVTIPWTEPLQLIILAVVVAVSRQLIRILDLVVKE